MTEYYRHFAFVSSVLAEFAFTLDAALLAIPRENRAATWGTSLVVTLSTTFAAARVSRLPEGSELPVELAAHLSPLSMLFLIGVCFCSPVLDSAARFAHGDSELRRLPSRFSV